MTTFISNISYNYTTIWFHVGITNASWRCDLTDLNNVVENTVSGNNYGDYSLTVKTSGTHYLKLYCLWSSTTTPCETYTINFSVSTPVISNIHAVDQGNGVVNLSWDMDKPGYYVKITQDGVNIRQIEGLLGTNSQLFSSVSTGTHTFCVDVI